MENCLQIEAVTISEEASDVHLVDFCALGYFEGGELRNGSALAQQLDGGVDELELGYIRAVVCRADGRARLLSLGHYFDFTVVISRQRLVKSAERTNRPHVHFPALTIGIYLVTASSWISSPRIRVVVFSRTDVAGPGYLNQHFVGQYLGQLILGRQIPVRKILRSSICACNGSCISEIRPFDSLIDHCECVFVTRAN